MVEILSICLFVVGLSSFSLQSQQMSVQANECIRKTVYAEARGESELGQRAVAHVILNRARENNRSICSVVRQHGQFKQGNPSKSFKVPLLGRDPTNGATHFRTKDMSMWLGLKNKVRIGGHTFYGR